MKGSEIREINAWERSSEPGVLPSFQDTFLCVSSKDLYLEFLLIFFKQGSYFYFQHFLLSTLLLYATNKCTEQHCHRKS